MIDQVDPRTAAMATAVFYGSTNTAGTQPVADFGSLVLTAQLNRQTFTRA